MSDSGQILFTGGLQRLYVVPFGGSAWVIARTDFDPGYVRVSGSWVAELGAVLIAERSAESTAYRVQTLGGGRSKPILTGSGCGLRSIRGHAAVFGCPDGSFEWADLSTPAPATESLAALTPAGPATANGLFEFEWVGLAWYDLVFHNLVDGGCIRVLYQADTLETMALGEYGTNLSSWAFLPPATYRLR